MPAELTLPILRLELQASKLAIATALDDRHQELKQMLDLAFVNAIPHLQAQMDRAVLRVADELIDRVAKSAVDDITDDLVDALSARMTTVFTAAIREKLGGQRNG